MTSDSIQRDDVMRELGYHKHKPTMHKRGMYFKVGGNSVTKDEANAIVKLIQRKQTEARLDEQRRTFYDGSILVFLHDEDDQVGYQKERIATLTNQIDKEQSND